MAGDRFTFTTYSDDNRGTIVKSDDQKNKQANGTGVIPGKLIIDCPVEFSKEVTGVGGSPTGSIMAFAGKSAPSGWLMCDGRKYDRADYTELSGVLGTTFKARPLGEGQMGATVVVDQNVEFYVPDLRGRTVAGFGDVSGWPGVIGDLDLGEVVGAETHKLTEAEMPKHTHNYTRYGSTGSGGPISLDDRCPNSTYKTAPAGGDQPHNIVQPTMALNYIIKT
jgi:microcystin-dependent protein